MFHIPTDQFETIVHDAVENLPAVHRDRLQNVAIFVSQIPNASQKEKAHLQAGGLLLGLYEGVPLSQRRGATKLLPDIITIFQEPIELSVNSYEKLKLQVKHTVWHEVAHYFGLDHKRIKEIEQSFEQ